MRAIVSASLVEELSDPSGTTPPLLGSSGKLDDVVGSASKPVLRMIEPSKRDKMRVDWTPGLAASLDRFSSVDKG